VAAKIKTDMPLLPRAIPALAFVLVQACARKHGSLGGAMLERGRPIYDAASVRKTSRCRANLEKLGSHTAKNAFRDDPWIESLGGQGVFNLLPS
jgi:hypothetical protein